MQLISSCSTYCGSLSCPMHHADRTKAQCSASHGQRKARGKNQTPHTGLLQGVVSQCDSEDDIRRGRSLALFEGTGGQ